MADLDLDVDGIISKLLEGVYEMGKKEKDVGLLKYAHVSFLENRISLFFFFYPPLLMSTIYIIRLHPHKLFSSNDPTAPS